MALKQLIGISWNSEREPNFIFKQIGDSDFHYVPAVGYIRMIKQYQRFCVGYFDLSVVEARPCPKSVELEHDDTNRCPTCRNRTGFDSCLRCTGLDCKTTSELAKKFCVLPHLVYLAYFSSQEFKIGTAVEVRAPRRLLEQGACYSLFLARANGRIARGIETAISRQGIKTRLLRMQKAKWLIQTQRADVIECLLRDKATVLCAGLPDYLKRCLIPMQFNNFYPAKLPNVLYSLVRADSLVGEIVAIVGSFLLLRDRGLYSVVDLTLFFGWLVQVEITSN